MKNAQVTKAANVEATVEAAAPAAPVKAKRASRTKVEAKTDAMSAIVASAATVEAIKAADAAAAPAKKARTVRPAQKPVEKKESAVVTTVSALPVKFVITGAARPAAGRHLFAHTEAHFQLCGMYKGGAMDRKALTDIMGATAISYHMSKGNFEATTKGIQLTAQGVNHFTARGMDGKYDPKDVEAYKEILTSGALDGRLVKVKEFIREIKA